MSANKKQPPEKKETEKKEVEVKPGRPTAREVLAALFPEHDTAMESKAHDFVQLPVPGAPSEFSGEFGCKPSLMLHTVVTANRSGKDLLLLCSCGTKLLASAQRQAPVELRNGAGWIADGLRNVPSRIEEAAT